MKSKPAVRGRTSYVLKNETKGGMITIRIPPDVHLQLAKVCKARKVSMNNMVLELIKKEIGYDST